MIDYSYEDLETEAVQEREENEKYEAECSKEGGLEKNEHLFHIPAGPKEPIEPIKPFEPTPTKAQSVKRQAEVLLKATSHNIIRPYDDAICNLIIQLAEAIDER